MKDNDDVNKIYFDILNGSIKVLTESNCMQRMTERAWSTILEKRISHAEYFCQLIKKLQRRKQVLNNTRRRIIENKIEGLINSYSKSGIHNARQLSDGEGYQNFIG